MSAKEINSITGLIGSANLKAYYRFEDGALTTDSSGKGHTLTAIGSPYGVTGKFGGGVYTTTGPDVFSAVNHADFRPTTAFAIGGWYYTTYTGTNTHFIFQSYSKNTNHAGFYIYLNGSHNFGMLIGRNTGTTSRTDYKSTVGSTAVNDGNYHLLIAVWDGSYIRIYVDGEEEASGAWNKAPGYASTNYIRVGCRCQTGSNDTIFKGGHDDVFLWSGGLTAEEVKGIYTGWKKYNGLSNVSVKSVDGLAVSSINTFNGI